MKNNNNKKDSFDMNNIIKYKINPPQISEIQLEYIKTANEQFGVKILSLEDLGRMRLTPDNVKLLNRNIQREYKIITGEYLRDRNTTYLNNYIDILIKAGVNEEIINRLKEIFTEFISKNNTIQGKEYMISSLLPPLKEFYITLKRGRDKRGRFISIDEQVDTIEEQVTTALDDLESLGYV